MPFQDFRDFLDALQKAGELLELDRFVSPELDVAKAMKKSASVSGPAIVFKKNGTTFPLVGGIYNTRAKCLIALQTTEKGRIRPGAEGNGVTDSAGDGGGWSCA
jgi:2,5-furandicarboxylate decarboxylase 1